MDAENNRNKGLSALTINENIYKELLRMLESTEEDQVLALLCIKNMNKQRNLSAIAFLRKNANCVTKLWEEHCYAHIQYQKSLGIPEGVGITFEVVHNALNRESKYKDENRKFFIARYVDYLKENLIRMAFVESVEIIVKIKDYEQ
jgi:hypothetical protein